MNYRQSVEHYELTEIFFKYLIHVFFWLNMLALCIMTLWCQTGRPVETLSCTVQDRCSNSNLTVLTVVRVLTFALLSHYRVNSTAPETVYVLINGQSFQCTRQNSPTDELLREKQEVWCEYTTPLVWWSVLDNLSNGIHSIKSILFGYNLDTSLYISFYS